MVFCAKSNLVAIFGLITFVISAVNFSLAAVRAHYLVKYGIKPSDGAVFWISVVVSWGSVMLLSMLMVIVHHISGMVGLKGIVQRACCRMC